MKIDKNRAGKSLGITFAAFHSAWLILSLVGVGHLWFSSMHELHFLGVEYEMLSFDPIKAIIGLAGAFVVGYAIGWVFGFVWEKVGK